MTKLAVSRFSICLMIVVEATWSSLFGTRACGYRGGRGSARGALSLEVHAKAFDLCVRVFQKLFGSC